MPGHADATETVHATCVALAGAGVLIRGASGSGKSTLALLLLDRAALLGLPAGLVGDDRVRLSRQDGTIVARPHPALADRVEVRGLGLLRARDTLDVATVRLVVDLVGACPRLPDDALAAVTLLGHTLPGLALDGAILRSGLAPRLVLDALGAGSGVASGTHRPVLAYPSGRGP